MMKKLIVAIVVGLGVAVGATQARVEMVEPPGTYKKASKAKAPSSTKRAHSEEQ